MKQLLVVFGVLAFAACSSTNDEVDSADATEVAERLSGVWRVVSIETIRESTSEAISPWLGPRPTGTLVYLPNGYMTVQLMRDPPPEFDADTYEGATLEEMKEAFLGYYAYYGTYTIDETRGSVTHHIESSLLPEEREVSMERFFELDGDHLSLETAPFMEEGERRVNRLVWERM